MAAAKIGRIALLVEIDGECCTVALPQSELRILVEMARSLSPNGRLQVIPGDGRLEFVEKPKAKGN